MRYVPARRSALICRVRTSVVRLVEDRRMLGGVVALPRAYDRRTDARNKMGTSAGAQVERANARIDIASEKNAIAFDSELLILWDTDTATEHNTVGELNGDHG
jgi:hypothetical protein